VLAGVEESWPAPTGRERTECGGGCAVSQCVCSKFSIACEYAPTQEDLLCDTCRKGCRGALQADGSVHVINVQIGPL
jgi:hypothetical protein